jgi:hypothetical protein
VNEYNPYAPSPASLSSGVVPPGFDNTGDWVWRDGDVLVILVARSGSALPRRCVKCNAAAVEPTKARYVYWRHPAIYLLLPFTLIFVIVVLIVRKKATVAPGLCGDHQKYHRRAQIFRWAGILSGLVLLFAGAASAFGLWGSMFGALILLSSIAVWMRFGRVVYAQKIDSTYARLRGCGRSFLESLPSFPGP